MNNQEKLNVGIVGGFQNGKSTFVNCMLDDLVARTGGEGVRVTTVNVKYTYGETQSVDYLSNRNVVETTTLRKFLQSKEFSPIINEVRVSLWKPILRYVNIVDTPGFNANDVDTSMALASLNDLDAAIIVVNNKGLSETEVQIMSSLSIRGIPFYVIMNCLNNGGDSWNPQSKFNEEKEKAISDAMRNKQFYPQRIENDRPIIRANFLWFWYSSEQFNQEENEKQEYLEDCINYYVNKQRKSGGKTPDKLFFRESSNLLPIRRYFDDERNWGFPINCIRWKAGFDKIFISWEEQLKSILQ